MFALFLSLVFSKDPWGAGGCRAGNSLPLSLWFQQHPVHIVPSTYAYGKAKRGRTDEVCSWGYVSDSIQRSALCTGHQGVFLAPRSHQEKNPSPCFVTSIIPPTPTYFYWVSAPMIDRKTGTRSGMQDWEGGGGGGWLAGLELGG